MTLIALGVLLSACGEDPAVPAPVALRAPDDSGIFVWVADSTALAEVVSAEGSTASLRWRDDGGPWYTAVGPVGEGLASGTRYWLPADRFGGADLATLDLRLAVGQLSSDLAAPERADLELDLSGPDAPFVGTDLVRLSTSPSLGPLAEGSGALELALDLTTATASTATWLSPDCLEGDAFDTCLDESLAVWTLDDVAALPELPALTMVHEQPAVIGISARLWLDAVDVDGSPVRGLVADASLADELFSLGRSLYWGDLHAHSNLSHDGCELPDDDCDHRGEYAGEDFFANAVDNDLDFVAITDHAEWERYYPDGLGGDYVDIWSEQQRLAEEAEAPGFVPLIGYEWTNKRDKPSESEADAYYAADYEGGHKTVVFQELDVPEDFRIGSTEEVDVTTKGGLSAYMVGDNPQTDDPQRFFDYLDDAGATHGTTPVLSFFHHPALEKPQGVDFGYALSTPDSRFERLIEIYSEHGSSECIEPTADDCDWYVNDDNFRYLTRGTVQYALSEGFRLGFVVGTDCHDSRPGSVDDGPSTHGNPGAAAGSELNEQFAPGGLTGAWIAGEIDRVGVFEALFDWATLGTSGPRPDGRVLAVDAQGRPWMPGQVLPADAGPLHILARMTADGYQTQRVSLVRADGEVVHEGEGPIFEYELELEADQAWYLRVVLLDVGGDSSGDSGGDEGSTGDDTPQEHRVWVSPFFTESDG